MGFTLDELLDVTGVKSLKSKPAEKTASQSVAVGSELQKLAARCRNAASTEVPVNPLREKIAAVAIYRQTLSEIRAIEEPGAIKTASVSPDIEAVFVKQALEAGHDPLDVATMLEKQAFLARVGRWAGRKTTEFKAGRNTAKAKATDALATFQAGKGGDQWKHLLRQSEHLPPAEKARLLSKLRSQVGDGDAYAVINNSGATSFLKMKEYKEFAKGLDAAKKAGNSKNAIQIGGLGVSAETLGKMKKPALYAAGGGLAYKAVSGGMKSPEPKKNDSGVVVINR